MSKQQVHDYWNANVCDTKQHLINGELKDAITKPKYTRDYFEEIERRRVASKGFAQPELYKGQKVLEVGVGSGVDFAQWAINGAEAYGVDLTEAAIEHTTKWMESYGLKADLRVADAEQLPFPDGMFDVVYSWGVLHHSPNTLQAISECVRVSKPGGEIKLMLYNRWSLLWAFAVVFKILTGKDIESPGTKAFPQAWVKDLPQHMGVKVESVKARTCEVDLIPRYGKIVSNWLRFVNWMAGDNSGFFMTIKLRKNV